jgi:salicylate hydroxylase
VRDPRSGQAERIFDIGVHYHEILSSWSSSSGRVVLLGDSAHAMPPFMGQGANQAMQDAYCLANKLSQVGTQYDSIQVRSSSHYPHPS